MAGTSAQQLASSLSGGSLRELRKRIFFVVIALVIFRIGTFIPVPGIDVNVMREIFEQQRTGAQQRGTEDQAQRADDQAQ